MAEQLQASADRIEQQNRDLIEARVRAEAGNRAKSEFLAAMSHEIRTPMNAVLGFIDLLLESELTTEQRRNCELVKQSAGSLMGIINDILDLSRLDAGKMPLERKAVDLRDLARGVVELMTPLARKKGLHLMLWVDEAVPEYVAGDALRLRQVLLNLVGNGVKFTARGEVGLSLRCEPGESPEAPRIRFEVRDTGSGVPRDLRPRLFEPFTQADSSTTRRFGGTGLGLAISRRIVTLMGGEIGLADTTGPGALFWFTIPFRRTVPPDERVGFEHFSSGRVLLIQDADDVADGMERQLKGWGLDVEVRHGAGAAVRRIQEAANAGMPFDISIADYGMLGRHGRGVPGLLIGGPLFEGPRLIVLSSTPDPQAELMMREEGMGEFLTKPVKPGQLHQVIAGILESRKAADSPDAAASKLPLPSVLLAEDNEINRIFAIELLQRLGFQPEVAANGHEVLERMAATPFDIVLMDCLMPELDGYEATRLLRQRESGTGRRAWVVALTANAMKEDRARCLEAGMDDYLSKPFQREALRLVLDRARRELAAKRQPG
jgi:CheY-like chemotaxis protein/nitrogen-specific signal transduction histidine kinase